MNRRRRINLEASTRCKICRDIEVYIEFLINQIRDNQDLLSWVEGASSIDFIKSEIKDLEFQIEIAQSVIEEILSNLKGDTHNVR